MSSAELPGIELMIMSGPDDGRVIRLEKARRGDGYYLGRDPQSCDLLVQYDRQVSRCHAILVLRQGVWYLRDMNSRNGTFLGKTRLPDGGEVPLPTGQLFRLARTWLRLQGILPAGDAPPS